MIRVTKVDLFRGFYVASEGIVKTTKDIRGSRLTKAEWEDFDDEAETIPFEYDKVIIDANDDCVVYFIKKV